MANEDDSYLESAATLTPENLQIFALWLGKPLSVPKNFDQMAQTLAVGTMLIHSIEIDPGRKIIFRAKAERWGNATVESTIRLAKKGEDGRYGYEGEYQKKDGLYTEGNNGEGWQLVKAVDFEKDEVLSFEKFSDARMLSYYLSGKAIELGHEGEVMQKLLESEGPHYLSDRQMAEAMQLLKLAPKGMILEKFRPIDHYNGRASDYNSRQTSTIEDVCELRREKDQKMVRVAILKVSRKYESKIMMLIVSEDKPIYNYIDKGRVIRLRNEEHLELYVDRSKDKSMFGLDDMEKMSEKCYKQLKEAFQKQIPEEVRKSDEYESAGLRPSHEVNYEEIFWGDDEETSRPDKRFVSATETVKMAAKSGKNLMVEVVDSGSVLSVVERIHQVEIETRMSNLETTVAHHLKTGKIARGERISLGGGVVVDNHVVDVMSNKIWIEHRKIEPGQRYKLVGADHLFQSRDMTADEMDLETVMKRVASFILNPYVDFRSSKTPCEPYSPINDLDLKKASSFIVHYNGFQLQFDFTQTSNGSSMMKINDARVGIENAQQILTRIPCFTSQKELNIFVENIAEIPFVAHDMLNEGLLAPPFRFRFKREGRTWSVQKNELEWVPIPGGFRTWKSMGVQMHNFTETLHKFSTKLEVPVEAVVAIFKTARAEYAISEARAKKLLDDTIRSLNGKASDIGEYVKVKGVSGTNYKVEKENLKVYAVNKSGGETYICIVDSGANVNKTDRLVSRILALANDVTASAQITTLAPYVNSRRQ